MNNYIENLPNDILNTIISFIDEYEIFSAFVDITSHNGKLPKEIIKYETSGKKTFLHFACQFGHFKMVKRLIDLGANVKDRDRHTIFTPLHYACENNNFEIVKILIDNGANVNALDLYADTSLHYACIFGNLPIVELLVNHKANIEARDTFYRSTPLCIAQGKGYMEISKFLIQCGAKQIYTIS